ncbi:hypothetical protein N9Y42_09285 [Mariniblastus sp.]|nr:hypothetical protein [Mariniblastus sp.]
MTSNTTPIWESMRTDESRLVEDKLHEYGFEQVDSYRYNSASVRVRIVDKRFEGIDRDERNKIVEPFIEQLPESTQADIVTLVLLSPKELETPNQTFREYMLNTEFDVPSPTML